MMAGTIGYAVKYARMGSNKFAGERVMGTYSTYERALERVKELAGGSTQDMITDWMICDWWWDSEKSITIDTFKMDEDVD